MKLAMRTARRDRAGNSSRHRANEKKTRRNYCFYTAADSTGHIFSSLWFSVYTTIALCINVLMLTLEKQQRVPIPFRG